MINTKLSISSFFYETSSVRIHYRLLLQPGKPTLVLIHPAFADQRIFEPQFDAFGSDYSTLAVDMIGHGQSKAKDSRVTLAEMPQLIKEIMDQHHIESAHLVGVSMGSLVAQNFAARFHERVLSVTVVGGYSIHQDVSDSSRAQRREMIRWIPMLIFSMPAFRRYVTRHSVGSELGIRLFSQGAERFTRRSFLSMRGAGQLLLPMEDRRPYPLLFVCGEWDNPIVLDLAKRITTQDRDAKLAIVPDAGHCANIDNPEAFNRILAAFIE